MKRLIPLLFLVTSAANAATFLVPSDRELIVHAPAVVVATAGASTARWSEGGWIETVTTMQVDEVIKGPLRNGEIFTVAELGGVVGEIGYAVPGAPRYALNERVLLFLEKDDRGQWTAKNMAVGKFTLTDGLLLRDARELCGWTMDGTPHREPQRNAEPFLDYVRRTARGENPSVDYIARDIAVEHADIEEHATVSSYLIQHSGGSGTRGIRWNIFPGTVVFRSRGTQPGAPGGGLTAVQRGIAAWNDDGDSNVSYSYGGTTTSTQGFNNSDNVNSIQFNDPSNEIPGSYSPVGGATLAIGGAWFGNSVHTYGGETFYSIAEADLVIQNGITGAGLTGNGFDHVVAHELGHTLGFRHSDEPPAGGTVASNALMFSTVNFNNDATGAALQGWDREALAAVYGSGGPPPPPCEPPSITTQPNSTTFTGSPVTLSVVATGSAPLSYQWFTGAKGNTANPIGGATTAFLTVSPTTTTSYWVRVTGACTPVAISNAAVVTVNGCPIVLIDAQSTDATLLQGRSTTLSVNASGGTLTYQWFANGSAVNGATGSSLVVQPNVTSQYYAEVRNSCGASVRSETITITVVPCNAARIVVEPSGSEVVVGDSVTLSATVIGTAPILLQWFEGQPGDRTRPVPNGIQETITVGPLFAPTSFWLAASNDCGDATSMAANVTMVTSCAAPAILEQPRDTVVGAGGNAVLTIRAAGTSLTYRWFEGPLLDFTKPVGGSSPSLYTKAIDAPTQYWVRITNGCGSVNSSVATVAPGTVRRRAVR